MSSSEVLKHLGEPLLRSKARGAERWIYDGSGEVFFYSGPVMHWTVARPTPVSEAKPIETDVMFRPARVPRFPLFQASAPPVTAESTATDDSRFRYR